MSARKTLKQEAKIAAERNRSNHLKEMANIEAYDKFVAYMFEKYRVKIIVFQGERNHNLPPYMIAKEDGRCIGFADILFQPLDDYIKIPMGRFRNGVFVTEIFGVIKAQDAKECSPMRYVVFLLHKEDVYQFSYKKRPKPFPTLPEGEGETVVVLLRRDFTPI